MGVNDVDEKCGVCYRVYPAGGAFIPSTTRASYLPSCDVVYGVCGRCEKWGGKKTREE